MRFPNRTSDIVGGVFNADALIYNRAYKELQQEIITKLTLIVRLRNRTR